MTRVKSWGALIGTRVKMEPLRGNRGKGSWGGGVVRPLMRAAVGCRGERRGSVGGEEGLAGEAAVVGAARL